jgi:hypothetical protein
MIMAPLARMSGGMTRRRSGAIVTARRAPRARGAMRLVFARGDATHVCARRCDSCSRAAMRLMFARGAMRLMFVPRNATHVILRAVAGSTPEEALPGAWILRLRAG